MFKIIRTEQHEPGRVTVYFRLRRKHPALWLLLWRVINHTADESGWSKYDPHRLLAFLRAWWMLVVKK